MFESHQTVFFDMYKSEEKLIIISDLYPDLYPDLSAEERREAEENLRRYLALVKRIYEYVAEKDPKILTELRKRARLRRRGKRRLNKREILAPHPN